MRKDANTPNDSEAVPLLGSSTFYLKTDFKYFLTFNVNHSEVNSSLEAYKIGPIRAIVRVTFFYTILKINFQLGMYTEVSLFANSVILPAILYNPINGPKTLNAGSGFYYGFSVLDNPNSYDIKTNIPSYAGGDQKGAGILNMFKTVQQKGDGNYWLSMTKPDRLMHFEVGISKDLVRQGAHPSLYLENVPGKEIITQRSNSKPMPLGKSPVNIALYFDITKFTEGEHIVSFKLFFENQYSDKLLNTYKNLNTWQVDAKRM
jgi:hypothetical protein